MLQTKINDVIFYGYFTNSQSDYLSDGLIAQLVEYRYRRGHGFKSRSGLNFFFFIL